MRSFKILILVGLFAAVTLAPSAAQATDFSIFASYWETDDFDEAVGVGFRVAFFERVQLELGATYYDEFGNDFQFDFNDPGFDNVTLDVNVIPVDIGVRFNLGDGPIYIGVGGTAFFFDSNSGDLGDEFGFYGRIGAQFQSFFLEAGLRDVDGTFDRLSIGGIATNNDVPIDLSGYTVNAGWRF
jgi:hypothetical protein